MSAGVVPGPILLGRCRQVGVAPASGRSGRHVAPVALFNQSWHYRANQLPRRTAMTAAPPTIIDYSHGISAIDTAYIRPMLDASHLVMDAGEAAFVDVATSHAVPRLLAALAQKGIKREQVKYVCVTHIHLDHAGGAGELLRHLPRATLIVHPRGQRHMVDPTKLIAGTATVYGVDQARRLFGEIVPISAERVQAVHDGSRLQLGEREFVFVDTPGHAYHHYSIVDAGSGGIFSGDTFGISYRELDTHRGPFIFPTSSPVHFDPVAAHASIDRLMSFTPDAIYITHFGRVTDLNRLAEDLHRELDAFVDIARRHAGAGAERLRRISQEMRAHLGERLTAHGSRLSAAQIDAIVMMDVDLNAQGLVVWLDSQET